jgi:acyl-CoA synthetase (AMP-forming)/AMP-acid ligase II
MSYNIARLLTETAHKNPQGQAIIAPGCVPPGQPGKTLKPAAIPGLPEPGEWQSVTFAELDEWTSRIAGGLTEFGIKRGTRTLVMVRAGMELIALTFALFKAGAVPVLIDPGMGIKGFLACVERSKPEALVGIPLAHGLSLFFPGRFKSLQKRVTVGTRWLWGGSSLTRLQQHAPVEAVQSDAEELAAILFTSGSTGPAKGACYTHAIFDAQTRSLQAVFDFQPGEVDAAAFPLFSLFDCALGMTSVIPRLDPARPGSCDPAQVALALALFQATTATGSPAIWKRAFLWCAQNQLKLPHMRRLLTFGAPISVPLIRVAQDIMPQGDVYTPYGATESLPVACIRGQEVLSETAARTETGAGTCVGRPAGVEVRIIPIQDSPLQSLPDALPIGTIGEICVSGPVVTASYDALPEATAAAKIKVDGAVWHRMGDLGYLDEQGRLWFCGRKMERLQTAQGPLYTEPVEGRFNSWPEVGRCALVGPGHPGSQRPVIVVEGPENPSLKAKILETKLVEEVVFRASLPVDTRHNAKIHRLSLKKELEAQRSLR